MKMGSDDAIIPEELVVEILSWVPVKALMRFRRVSKSWNSLIFDPTLVKLQFQISSTDNSVLFTLCDPFTFRDVLCSLHYCSMDCVLEDPLSTVNVVNGGIPFGPKYTVVRVCNGLICLRYMSHRFEAAQVQFWNPATRLRSPHSPFIHSSFGCVKMGFSYDESSDTYKVMAVIVDGESRKIELRVHCLGDNCWRKIASGTDVPTKILQVKGLFLNGTLNWAAELGTSNDPYVIFSFDIRNETYRYLSLPVHVQYGEPNVGILEGCLCLSHSNHGRDISIWKMKEFGVQKSWTLLTKISHEHFELGFSYPLCIFANTHVLLLGNNSKYQIFPCKRRNIKLMCTDIRLIGVSFHSFDYVQSLVLPYSKWSSSVTFPLSQFLEVVLEPYHFNHGKDKQCEIMLCFTNFLFILLAIVMFMIVASKSWD